MKTVFEAIENDVFHARWKDTTKSNHCFEGLLRASKVTDEDGSNPRIILFDTFWRSGGNKWFTLDDADKQLDCKYYCNLDDYDLVNVKDAKKYYEPTDYIFMHDQHACVESCKYYYLKKGAQKSANVIIDNLRQKIEEKKREIASCQRSIEWAEKDIEKVLQGDLSVWI